jgi:hypothetical protein
MSSPPPVRDRIVELFESHRERPGTPFDAAHFLDFLMAVPKGKGAVRNSFRGLRRFNAFIDAVQLEFAVCFSIRDRESNLSLDDFVARVEALRASPASSLASLRNQVQRGFGVQVWVVANVVLLPVVALAHRHPVALVVAVALVFAINAGFAWMFVDYRRYNEKLMQLLQAKQDAPRHPGAAP